MPKSFFEYIDLTLKDGLWYCRLTSETAAGNESPPSEQVSAESDSVMPRAVSISYAPSGPHDPATGRIGTGRVELVLAASEHLAAIPFLSVTPENGLPIMVDLKRESETLFSGAFDIEETTKTGVAWAVFSGRDPAGNRRSRIDSGEFVLSCGPSPGDAGIYSVSVLHPDATERTTHGTFKIERVKIEPQIAKMDVPVNHEQTVNISASVSEGLGIENLRLACEDADQPGGSLPEGVHVACGPAVGHAEAGSSALFFTVMADDSAPDSADIVPRLVGDPPSDEPWAYVTVNAKFSDASPRLEVSPDRIDTGVVRGESVSETFAQKNTGYEKMENVRIRLTDAGGEPAPDWIMPSCEKSIGDIGIGETKQAGLVLSPTESTPEGLLDFSLHIVSDNHPEALICVRVAVVQSGTGSALVKVSDIYTGTVDPETSRTIEGLSGASVVLQNEAVATEVYTAKTDAAGEALFSGIPAGLYACRVSADGHNPHSGTVKIKPGLTANESVFLMNRLVTVEWSVTETTIEDVYEIETVATFETDVPAPVVVFEPAGIVLPSGMKAGDVHRGEFKMTNQGLVRAESIRFDLSENDPYFQFELADALPETLDAKQTATIAYRVVCLKSIGDDQSDGSGGDTECAQYTYEADIRVVAEATCSDGVPRDFYWDQKIKVPGGKIAAPDVFTASPPRTSSHKLLLPRRFCHPR